MSGPPDLDLVALVGSRIAHDLISPLGAIGNGVELLALSDLGDLPELALITQSVDNANTRIKTFRLAFGAARPDQTVAADEIRALFPPTADDRRRSVDWQPNGPLPRGPVKLAVLSLMCLETVMPWGGTVRVTQDDDRWQITGTAPRWRDAADLWQVITPPEPRSETPADVQPAHVHFPLLAVEARAQNRPLAVQRSATATTIGF